ncbi:PAS domain-containing protein [Nitrincola alkalilacustris]|uniref:PAS domain-containing protein n=1 Tax=Nitrincola alkalilacustris TaxID=1571224 RepID=UPI00124CC563|nr:PAS domain-containing protein [Nitrincola alkalilacustris]
MSNDVYIYRIDSTDTIISISDNWGGFADSNAWNSYQAPEEVVGRKLWDFIQDLETQQLYQELFKRVRAGVKSSVTIPFRCDSPVERRYLELQIEALPDEQIKITSTICRTEPRPYTSLLDTQIPRSSDIVTVCSMCKKLKISSEQWAELEEGLAHLRLFEADKVPQLSHGLCRSCFQVSMRELDGPSCSHS